MAEDPEAFAKEAKGDAQDARRDGDYEEAERIVDNAIRRLRTAMGELQDEAQVGDRAMKLARALSDSYGVLGGIRRDAGRHADSADAYDKGKELEQDPRYGMINSYNLVQRLVVRVVGNPGALTADRKLQTDLAAALDTIRRQIAGPRQHDPWAWADLAITSLLLGREPEEGDAWSKLRHMKPPAYVFGSTHKVVSDLRTAVGKAKPDPALQGLTARLGVAVELLERAQTEASASSRV